MVKLWREDITCINCKVFMITLGNHSRNIYNYSIIKSKGTYNADRLSKCWMNKSKGDNKFHISRLFVGS